MNDTNKIVFLPMYGLNSIRLVYEKTERISVLSKEFKEKIADYVDTTCLEDAMLQEAYYSSLIDYRAELTGGSIAKRSLDCGIMTACYNSAIKQLPTDSFNLNSMVTLWVIMNKEINESGDIFRKQVLYTKGDVEISLSQLQPENIRTALDHMFYCYAKPTPKGEELVKAIVTQFYIEYLSPMAYGNGRLSRLVLLWSLLEFGMDAARYLPISEMIQHDIDKYNKIFAESVKKKYISNIPCLDLTAYIEFMLVVLVDAATISSIEMSTE